MLCGQPGIAVEVTDHAGRVQQAFHETEPVAGRDVTLTIDPRLQRTAEELLDSALQRVALQSDRRASRRAGAVVVIDVHNGEILAAASAPRFDPAAFVGDDSSRREALLADPAHPLFHRAIQMALPPGSVFKTVTAVALLESAGLDPAATFYCQGYLKQPDRQRCAVYVRHGTGHGDVTLAEALAESCNVYFFHHAEKLPPQALVDWARRLGFGQPTGVDLPGEARGIVPAPDSIRKLEGHGWHTADTQAMSVGQGSLTATPLQVVRMMAAVANGGLLVTPHVVRQELASGDHAVPAAAAGPGADLLDTCRHSRRAVADGGRQGRHGPRFALSPADFHCRQDGHGRDWRGPARPRLVRRLCSGRSAPLRDGRRPGAGRRRRHRRLSRGQAAGAADAGNGASGSEDRERS